MILHSYSYTYSPTILEILDVSHCSSRLSNSSPIFGHLPLRGDQRRFRGCFGAAVPRHGKQIQGVEDHGERGKNVEMMVEMMGIIDEYRY